MFKKSFLFTSLALLIFGLSIFYFIKSRNALQLQQNVMYQNESVSVNLPSCPLKTGSLTISSTLPQKSIIEWTSQQHAKSYNLMQNIAAFWRENNFIDDFMIIGMMPPRMHASSFFWEIIPFTKNSYNFLDQFGVVWRLAFDSPCLSDKERQSIANQYMNLITIFSLPYQPLPETTPCTSEDAFCRPSVIAKQLLYEGNLMYILYNYAPIGLGEEKLHFMIIPKNHRTGFPQLTLNEYLEAQEMSIKLMNYFTKKEFPIVYLFHKTGKLAGQTVPHWHEHLIFASNESNEFWGKLIIMSKKLFPSKALPENELKVLVNKYRQQVQEAMK